jgi:hypothetical protein
MTRPYPRCWPANGATFLYATRGKREKKEGHEIRVALTEQIAVVSNSNRGPALCATSGSDVCNVVLQSPAEQASFGPCAVWAFVVRERGGNRQPGWVHQMRDAGLTAHKSPSCD